MVGILRTALTAATQILAPLVERDPEVYEARAAKRWSKRYVALSILAHNEEDSDKRHRLLARALAARTALAQLPVAPDVMRQLDLAVSLSRESN